jgi:hypothetical protein
MAFRAGSARLNISTGGLFQMKKFVSVRFLALLLMLCALSLVAVGCGDDNDATNTGTQTGEGAPDGAKGGESGGAAVEAGKQRSDEDKKNEAENFSEEPPPIQIQSGGRSGYSVNKPTVVVMRTQSEANAFKKKLYAGLSSDEKAPWASTDFKSRQFVAIVLPKSKAGTQVMITDISQNGKTIKVKAVQLGPGAGCKASGKASPWHVVETRQMKGDAVVALTKQNSSPC